MPLPEAVARCSMGTGYDVGTAAGGRRVIATIAIILVLLVLRLLFGREDLVGWLDVLVLFGGLGLVLTMGALGLSLMPLIASMG